LTKGDYTNASKDPKELAKEELMALGKGEVSPKGRWICSLK